MTPLIPVLQGIWYNLRAEHQLLWAYHWRSKGTEYYGDHLLYQRLYEARVPEIDKLAEVLVGVGGAESVDPDAAAKAIQMQVARTESLKLGDAAKAGALIQDTLQKIEDADAEIRKSPYSVAINNVVAAIADAHLEALYLLKRRMAP